MSSKNAEKKPNILPVVFIAIAALGCGTIFYHHVERLKWLDSIYLSVITLTTVGYGDITPKTDAGKIFTIFYVLIGIGVIAGAANFLLRQALNRRIEKKQSNYNKKFTK